MNSRPSPTIARPVPSLTAAAVLLAFAATAWGQPPPRRHQPSERCRKLMYQRHFAAYDSDKDGRLDRDELRAMMDARRAADLAEYDANGDGKLDRKERAKLDYDRLVEHFEEMDQNHDAEISRAEASASCGPLADHFDGADTDHDGVVTWTEFENGAKRARRMHRPGPGPGPDGPGPDGPGPDGPGPDGPGPDQPPPPPADAD